MAWLHTAWHTTLHIIGRTIWRRGHRQRHLLNLLALAILVFVLLQGSRGWDGNGEGFDAGLESGKWGVRWLLICLAMTPLQSYLHWNGAAKLRKAAGLWAFAFGAIHLLLYADETWQSVPGELPWHWLAWPVQPYIALGIISFLLLAVLAITSNQWAMRQLGKGWKRLHRLVYGLGVLVIVHALLASAMSKKMMVRDPQAVPELQLYLGILLVLLTLRIPQVRALLLKRGVRVNAVSPARFSALPLPKDLPPHLPRIPTIPVDSKAAAKPRTIPASGIVIGRISGTTEPVQEREREPVA